MLRGEDETEPVANLSPTNGRGSSASKFLGSPRSRTDSCEDNSDNGATSPLRLPSGMVFTGPNPAAQAQWSLGKDPDPMMQALLENMLAIESSLLELKMKAKMFQDSAGFVCRTMNDQASCYARLCKDHATLASTTTSYAAVTKTALQEKAFNQLCEALELKVYEPIKVNLFVLGEIKARAHERDNLRKKARPSSSKGPVAVVSQEFATLTARLFDELAALQQHRFDFIRGLYEGLKSAQRRFFADISSALESPDLDVVILPKSLPSISRTASGPSEGTARQDAAKTMSTLSMTTLGAPTPIVVKPSEIVIATPMVSKFDPLADQIKESIAPSFSRLKNKPDSGADHFDDVEEEDAWSSKVSAIKLPPATRPVNAVHALGKSEVPSRHLVSTSSSDRALIDEDEDSDFDTV